MGMSKVYSVSEFVDGVNALLKGVPAVVQGEVTGFRVSQNRFVWFDIKDESSAVSCFMMKFQLDVPLEDGMQVEITGAPGLFKKSGKFHLKANRVRVVGEGGLKQEYEKLKASLQKEGLFDESRKRSLPRFPKRIGIITSEDAAAYTDVKRVLANRWLGLDITLFHVQVQGASAATSIVSACDRINAEYADKLDVVIVTRGGGSMEDLHAFNDESVVRSVYGLQVPTVVGVGHERDETLVEFVADVRASTPSNAAEFTVPHRDDVAQQISLLAERAERELVDSVREYHQAVQSATYTLDQFAQQLHLRVRMALQRFGEQLQAWEHRTQQQLQAIRNVSTLLVNAHPAKILSRGYSILRDSSGKVIREAKQATSKASVTIQVSDGTIDATID